MKICTKCKRELNNNDFYKNQNWCKYCKRIYATENRVHINKQINDKRHANKEKFLNKCHKYYLTKRKYLKGIVDPNSKQGITIITEHITSIILNDCIKCNINYNFNNEYDLISKKYGTINVKSAILYTDKYNNSNWKFVHKPTSKMPEIFICIAFNKDRSNIDHVWVIPKESKLIGSYGICIANSIKGLTRASKYEIDSIPYNKLYQSLDIYSLPEFCNLNNIKGEDYATA